MQRVEIPAKRAAKPDQLGNTGAGVNDELAALGGECMYVGQRSAPVVNGPNFGQEASISKSSRQVYTIAEPPQLALVDAVCRRGTNSCAFCTDMVSYYWLWLKNTQSSQETSVCLRRVDEK